MHPQRFCFSRRAPMVVEGILYRAYVKGKT
jgi:hypothetical protein